jgi:hypothetical protein
MFPTLKCGEMYAISLISVPDILILFNLDLKFVKYNFCSLEPSLLISVHYPQSGCAEARENKAHYLLDTIGF